MKKLLFFTLSFFFAGNLIAQNVGIGTTTPSASAMLDISATNKGLLIPQVSLTGVNDNTTIPGAPTSLLIYNTSNAGSGAGAVTPGYYYWDRVLLTWIRFTDANSSPTAWQLNGNTSTAAASNFIGTTDNQSLQFKISNTPAGFLGTNGNTYWGLNSGNINSTGFSNVAIGNAALSQNTNRSNLVAVGDSALYNNGIGVTLAVEATGNTAIGSKSLFTNKKGYYNTALGLQTLYSNTKGNYNTAIGVQALYYDTSGSFNSSVGYEALTNNTNGSNNTATGFQSLLSNTTGINNTANGASSLVLTSTGTNNTANGYLALFGNTTGNNNAAVGSAALISNTTGYSNVGIGISALNSNATGSNSVAVGDSALYNNGTGATAAQGIENTAIGSKALITNTTGNNNTALGSQADMAAANLNNATAIGNRSFVNCSNCMVLGSVNGLNGAASSVKVGIGTSTPLMGIHVAKTDSAVALFENTQALNTDVSNALYFKTGNSSSAYTGAVKTIGQNATNARLGFFTGASGSPNQLLERLTIANSGNIGIGTNSPSVKLDVKGDTYITGNAVVFGQTTLNGNQTVNGNAAINGNITVVNGSVILPIQVVLNNYTVVASDYTIVADMQNDPNKAVQIFLPTTAVVGRVVKIVAINMAQKFTNPNQVYPFNGTVSIYTQTQNLNYRIQSLSSYFVNRTNVVSPAPNFIGYDIVDDYEITTSCSLQYAGGTAGWVVTDMKSEKYNGIYYIH
jgi:hypothetical protein